MSACTCGAVHSVNWRRVTVRTLDAMTRTRWPVFAALPVLVMMFVPHAVGVAALVVSVVLVLLRLGRLVPWRRVAWHLRPLAT